MMESIFLHPKNTTIKSKNRTASESMCLVMKMDTIPHSHLQRDIRRPNERITDHQRRKEALRPHKRL